MPCTAYFLTYPTDAAEVVETLAAVARQAYDDLEIGQTGAIWGGMRRDRIIDITKPVRRFRQRRSGLALSNSIRRGDVLIFPEYDRAFRSFADFVVRCRQWIEGGVRAIFLDVGLDTATEAGQGVLAIWAKIKAAHDTRGYDDSAVRRAARLSRPGRQNIGRPILGLEARGTKHSRHLWVLPEVYDLGYKVKEWVDDGRTYGAIAEYLWENKVFRPHDTRLSGKKMHQTVRETLAWTKAALITLVDNLPKIDDMVLDGKAKMPAAWKPPGGPLAEFRGVVRPSGPQLRPASRWMKAKAIGRKVRELRKKRQMTQVQLAEAMKTKQSNISEIERGVVLPITTTLAALAQIFGVTLDVFQEAIPATAPAPPPTVPEPNSHVYKESDCPVIDA